MKRRATKPGMAALAQAQQDRGLAATKAGIVEQWERITAGAERCRYRLPRGLAVVREDQVDTARHPVVAPFVGFTVDRLTDLLCKAGSEQALADLLGYPSRRLNWWSLIAPEATNACLVRVEP